MAGTSERSRSSETRRRFSASSVPDDDRRSRRRICFFRSAAPASSRAIAAQKPASFWSVRSNWTSRSCDGDSTGDGGRFSSTALVREWLRTPTITDVPPPIVSHRWQHADAHHQVKARSGTAEM